MQKFFTYLCSPERENGVVAQVVEQWTENPCVAGSTPANTTETPLYNNVEGCFFSL